MLSNHLDIPSTSYSSRSDHQQSNLELESLRENNRELSEALARTRQELSIALENTNSLRTKYLGLHVKYCRLEKLVKTNVYELSNFLNEPRPQNPADQIRNSSNECVVPTRPQTQKVLKTQLVLPTVNGHVIQVPRITLDRLDNIELDSNRRTTLSNTSLAPTQSITDIDSNSSESDTEENEALSSQSDHEQPVDLTSNQVDNSQPSDFNSQEEDLLDTGRADVEVYLSRFIAQEGGLDEPSSTISDNMENMRIVLERLPTNLSSIPLPEEPSDSNLNDPVGSSSTNNSVSLVSQPTSTSLTNMVDSTMETQESVSHSHLSGPGCSSSGGHSSSISTSKKFSSISQLTAMKMLGLELAATSSKSSPSSIRSRLRRSRKKTSPSTTPPQQKNRKRKLNPKCSNPSIRKNRISDDKIVMVLLDRKEMSKLLLLRNPVVRIRRMLDNKTNSKTESKSSRKKITASRSSNVDSRTTASSDVGSQTGQTKKKPKNRQNEVASESFIKRHLSVKVTKLKALT